MRALATAVAFLAAFLQSAATMQTIEVAPWQPPYPIVEPPQYETLSLFPPPPEH